MPALFLHISGLIGLLLFLGTMGRAGAVAHSLWVGAWGGVAVYAALVLGYYLVKRLVLHGAPHPSSRALNTPSS